MRNGLFGRGFDLVMMVYGRFNVFPRDRGLEILKNAHRALKPGGGLLLEVQSREQIRREGEKAPSWYTALSGLFSEAPHLVLQENFWDADAGASTTRFSIIDGRTGRVSTYALSNEAYRENELTGARDRGLVFQEEANPGRGRLALSRPPAISKPWSPW